MQSNHLATAAPGICDDEAARDALARILASKTFAEVPRLSRFLKFVVEETLASRGDRLKGVTLAFEVFDKIDPSEAQSTTIVRVEAGRLRRRLTDYYGNEGMADPLRITIPKGGYMPVFEPGDNATEKATPPKQTHLPPITAEQSRQAPSRGHAARLGWSALLVTAVLVLAGALWRQDGDSELAGMVSDNVPVIAVLPFENFTQGQQHDGMGLEIADSLIGALSKRPDLKVIALSSTNYFRSDVLSVRDIGRDVKASHVLHGGYSSAPDSMRITVSLHDARSGYVIWSDEFHQDSKDATTEPINRILVGTVAGLGLGLPAGVTSHSRLNADRYALYTQARDLTHPPGNPLRVNLALGIFETLLREFPDFAEAYAGAAYAHSARVWWQHSEQPEEDAGRARGYAARALELDGHTGLAHLATGLLEMHAGNQDQAVLHLQMAVDAQPSNSLALAVLGIFRMWAGDPGESVQLIEEAIRLDPYNTRTPYWNILGTVQFHNGNYEKAVAALQKNINQGGPRPQSLDYYLAASLAAVGKEEDARKLLQSIKGRGDSGGWQHFVYHNFKDKSEFDHLMARLEPLGVKRAMVTTTR